MLVLHNVTMELSNVRKVQLNVMLILSNVIMELSNVKKKKKTTEFDKSTITCDVDTTQYDK